MRNWLLKLLIGKRWVIANAHVKGEVVVTGSDGLLIGNYIDAMAYQRCLSAHPNPVSKSTGAE